MTKNIVSAFHLALSQRRMNDCVALAQRALDNQEFSDEIIGFYTNYLFINGKVGEAMRCLTIADSQEPRSILQTILKAALFLQTKNPEQAEHLLASIKPGNHEKQYVEQVVLLKGIICALANERHKATSYILAALLPAQGSGIWLNDETTDPIFRALVRFAAEYAFRARRELLYETVNAIGVAESELRRVVRAIRLYLGEEHAASDELRKPSFLFLPDLPARQVFPSADLPYLAQVKGNIDIIEQELNESVIRAGVNIDAVHKYDDENLLGKLISGRHGKYSWSAKYFYRHGVKYPETHELCPKTSSILTELPVVNISGHSPEICFSVLKPGAKILPHVGVTNIRSVMHVPLVIPGDCALRIAGFGDLYWEKYSPFVFDDTFVHEAWNNSDSDRVVLLVDVWNPYLTDEERNAASSLITEISGLRILAEEYMSSLSM